ncbi:MAG: hypothetical protein HY852_04395 [Bradyrhizobium sp.]|uniref:hypothetical protein n=1 Tax=Bradyrhizobium sp. TaxID=376 RepID=UPI0025C3A343|nr:hypothetical protein [Bradyrhizobium sp.]MBI5261041.1 hypothetical protein [Bradyrhizobium sp.]
MSTFSFNPRWKEELVCSGGGGRFIIEFYMGKPSACLPSEQAWHNKAPEWARDLWPVLRDELEAWCVENKAGFAIDERALVFFDP